MGANALQHTEEINRGLRALGLVASLDTYWQRTARSSGAFWAANQRQVLFHATWSHWLHEYRGADNAAAIEAEYRLIKEDVDGRRFPDRHEEIV